MKTLKEKLNAKLSKKGGFTLVEMLVVIAIIAVLVAISIPSVSSQLEKAREAVDAANIRAAYAEAAIEALQDNSAKTKEVTLTQQTDGWVSTINWPKNLHHFLKRCF